MKIERKECKVCNRIPYIVIKDKFMIENGITCKECAKKLDVVWKDDK